MSTSTGEHPHHPTTQ